ncbi:hypothetical protein LTR28_000282, partial [Elasticomyces elasticus]
MVRTRSIRTNGFRLATNSEPLERPKSAKKNQQKEELPPMMRQLASHNRSPVLGRGEEGDDDVSTVHGEDLSEAAVRAREELRQQQEQEQQQSEMETPGARSRGGLRDQQQQQQQQQQQSEPVEDMEPEMSPPPSDVEDGMPEWAEDDPNEPRYCYCGKGSYGVMVGCDGPKCEREWFHLD